MGEMGSRLGLVNMEATRATGKAAESTPQAVGANRTGAHSPRGTARRRASNGQGPFSLNLTGQQTGAHRPRGRPGRRAVEDPSI